MDSQLHPATKDYISRLSDCHVFFCNIDWCDYDGPDRMPKFDIVLSLPKVGLNPGRIEFFVPTTEQEYFRFGPSLGAEIHSNSHTLEDPDDTLGGPPVEWISIYGMYGAKGISNMRLGIGYRLGELIDQLEGLKISARFPLVGQQLYSAYYMFLERDLMLYSERKKEFLVS